MARRTRSTLDVDAEYTKAFHTNSFVDIWSKAQCQFIVNASAVSCASAAPPQPPPPDQLDGGHHSSPLSHRSYTHLPDFLLEPRQDALLAAASSAGSSGGAASLLADYLDATFQSFTACASLLATIDRTRSLRRSISLLLPRLPSGAAADELSSCLDLGNPLSPPDLLHFHHSHALYPPLVRRLSAARRRLRRRARLLRAAKSTSGMIVISAVGAAAIVAVVVVTHAVAVAAAAAVAPLVAVGWRRWRLRWVEKAGRRVDAAARGAYIVRRDLDTVSRMVRRVHDEVEHGREVAKMAVRCGEEDEVRREVVRKMEAGEEGFEEKVEELEEHVYLCLLTINRSRRLVAEELEEEEDSLVHHLNEIPATFLHQNIKPDLKP